MLMDAARIQESDAVFASKIRRKHNQPPVEPLYTTADVDPVLGLLSAHGYNRQFKVLNDATAIFRNAGHVLGSAITVMDLNDGDHRISLCYTGDLGRPNLPIIKDPFKVKGADVLIIESTYGTRLHPDIANAEQKLADVINETVSRGGKILVPAFALERTQELTYTLHKLRLAKKIPEIPIFVDSPLATDATEVFRLHPECFDEEINKFLQNVEDPFGFKKLHYTRSVEESKMLNNINGPLMIIAGSGMAENGRILHHLKNNISDTRNTILIVGWQAENTLGRKIQEKWPQVPIFGEAYDLKAQVEVISEFSAHADRDELQNWVKQGKWGRIFLVHGEESTSLEFAADLRKLGLTNVVVPELGQSFEV